MQTADEPQVVNPWLSVWTQPRVTIAHVARSRSDDTVLLLGAASGVALLFGTFIGNGAADGIFDRYILAVILGGATFGVIFLLIASFAYRWGGKLLGGRASFRQVLAAAAWGFAPVAAGLAVSGVALISLKLFAAFDNINIQLTSMLGNYLLLVQLILYVWAFFLTAAMLSAVQKFGMIRAVANVLLGLVALVMVGVLFRTFVYHPYYIQSGAMKPTLLAGDHLFVSKFSYGYSRNSLPFRWNLFSGRILFRQPQRGDVVVFKVPRDPSIDYIKRLIGLPGDKIQMRGGTLYINDAPVPKRRVASFIDVEYGQRVRIVRFEETLPNGVKYFVLDSADTYQDNTAIYRVPERHYFAMGDHRDNSTDSRDLQSVGYIPEENLVGRAEWISISFDSDPSIKPSLGTSTVRSERFGLSISP